MKNLLPILGISLFLFSCGTNNDKDTNTQSESTIVEEKVSNCVFSYNNDATGIFWKAYKHTNKVGVNGRFDVFDVSFAEESNTIEGLLEGLKLSVDVQSVNSNDTLRDGKIRRHFFGSMLNTNMITGEIIAVNGSTGKLKMKLNDLEQTIPVDLSIVGEEVELRATIDILSFAANAAYDALGEACAEKHTGGDGVRKFWSDVDIYIKTVVAKSCPE